MSGQLLRGVSHEDYHADRLRCDRCALYGPDVNNPVKHEPGECAPRLSRSIALTLLSRSPLHAWHQHPKLGGGLAEAPTRSLEGGSLIHALLLGEGPQIEVVRVHTNKNRIGPTVAAEDYRKTEAQEERDRIRAAGGLPILQHQLDEAQEAVAKIRARLETVGVPLAFCEPEVTILWESNGVACKTRPDLLEVGVDQLNSRPTGLYDLKVVEEINELAFEATIDRYGLDMQHTAAVEGLTAVYPELAGRIDLLFVVVEKKPPYDVMVKPLSKPWQSLGESRWQRAKKLWRECLESNRWPGIGLRPPAIPRPYLEQRELEITLANLEEPGWAKGA